MRQEWNKEAEFVLACIGNAVGLGNLWRFPYLCYDSGGGAFLIPYFIMLIICGIPLLYMEISVGMVTRFGPVGALKTLCPLFQGAGLATVMLSFLFCSYYNVILSWSMYYLISSFKNPLPWIGCDNTWNTDQCWADPGKNSSTLRPNDSISASEEFYKHSVLQQSPGIDQQGTVIWYLALILLLSWIIVYFCLWKGVRWTGKVVYFTATFPYLILIILLVKGLTLPGSNVGVDFFVNPKWELLKQPKVWVNAAAQNFNSIGIAFGSMIAFASYSKRESRIFRDVMTICVINSATSIVAGFTVFSILGNIAFNQGQKVEDVVTQGPGLVFVVYPEAFVTMGYPWGQILAFLFFFMLICLAVDSQFASVEVVVTTLEDSFPDLIKRVLRRREFVVLILCIILYFLGFPNITNGGIYFFNIIDKYSSGISLMLIAFVEVVAVAWFYGGRKLAHNVEQMNGRRPFLYFVICWYFLSPLLILAIMIFNWIDYTPVSYGDYVYPKWADGIGWALACMSLVCIPLGMVKAVAESDGDNICRKFLKSLKSLPLPDMTPFADLQEANENMLDDEKPPAYPCLEMVGPDSKSATPSTPP